MKLVNVGPFKVCDATTQDVIAWAGLHAGERRVAYAVHVGGLNARNEAGFAEVINSGDLVYADGASVVLLARMAGAKRIERSATTDIGLPAIRRISQALGRDARVAILGGEPGVADRAGATISNLAPAQIVFVHHGFDLNNEAILKRMGKSSPDLIIVGLGMPREAFWVSENLERLPACIILTCGGWLGFLAGDEPRAPLILQKCGLEWAYRLWNSPRRLAARYAKGFSTTFVLLAKLLLDRVRNSSSARKQEDLTND